VWTNQVSGFQACVGHLSARMLRHYTHITSGAAHEAVAQLDAEPLLTPTLTGDSAPVVAADTSSHKLIQ